MKKGFTLIELLVVISIIVILITIGMTSLATAQKKGRDAKRKSDLREIKNALEQYFTICGYAYPTPYVNKYDTVSCSSPSQIIIQNSPNDPRTGADYTCPEVVSANCNASQFQLCATLEAESPTNYCVVNSQ